MKNILHSKYTDAVCMCVWILTAVLNIKHRRVIITKSVLLVGATE